MGFIIAYIKTLFRPFGDNGSGRGGDIAGGGKRGGKADRSSRSAVNEGKKSGGQASGSKLGMKPQDKDRNHNAPPGPPEAASTPRPDVIAPTLAVTSNADLQPLMDLSSDKLRLPVDTSLIKFISPATGLTVLSIVSNLPGHLVSLADRGYFIKILPSVVLINSSGRGESVLVGMDAPPDLVISTVEKLEKDTKNWSFNLEDVSGQDPFCFLRGWNIIPSVDKLGMYSLIVNLRMKGKTKMAEMEERKSLLTLIKEFNISKSMHGEGETMLQMSHVLEFITYSDCIRKQFALERRHTWQLKPLLNLTKSDDGGHKYFLIKTDNPEITKMANVAHKQFAVNHHLGSVGKVIQLEHELFGVPNTFLAVFDGKEKLSIKDLGSSFQVMELAPSSLPDSMMPTYGVDDFGFYTVSGTFPQNIEFELREKFSTDMKKAGAVGFRSGGSDEEFSLHFANSRCLEQINKTGLYTGFNLKIHSSLIKKPRLEKKIRKLVPAILKIKEVQNRSVDEVKGIKKVTIVEEPKDISRSSLNTSRSSLKSKDSSKSKENVPPVPPSIVVKYEQTPVKGKIQDQEELKKKVVTEVINSPSSSPTSASKPEVVVKGNQVVEFSESDLLKVNWTGGKGIPPASKNIGRFFNDIGKVDVAVDKDSLEVRFKAHDREKVFKNLKKLSHPETNAFEKLKKVREPKFVIQESKANDGMFGLSLPKKKIQKPELEKLLQDYSDFKIEDRAGVNIIWFKTKINYFKALADAKLNLGLYPCIVNFKDYKKADVPKVESSKKEIVPTQNPTKTSTFPPPPKIPERVPVKDTSGKEVYQLTEKQVFGFIWKKPDVRTRVRDDQVISRQLTEFIKTVNCTSIDNNEDGLVFTFSNKDSFNRALNQFFPVAVTDPSSLDVICRKFTLIPSRGSFGIFTSKRIRMEDLRKFGDCKLNMCSLWFSDKMEVIRILRDPVIAKLYPALYIDCRNIFILKSIRAPIPSPDGYIPSYKSVPRFSQRFPSPRPFYPVMGYRPPRPRFPAHDPAIVRAGPDSRASYHTSVLSQILPRTAQTNFQRPRFHPGSFKYDFMVGKFGVLPSTRFIKNGYKIYKNPNKGPSSLSDSELFLDDQERYRNKKAEDAADEVKNILNGKDGPQGTLKDMKMRRVEKFLKGKLGVEDVEVLAGNNNGGPNIFVNLVENGSIVERFEEVGDLSQDSLTPDLLGLYTITVPVTKETQDSMISALEDDVSWFEPPVSVLPVIAMTGDHILEVKMKEMEVAIATFQGLKHKYPGMDVDKTGIIVIFLGMFRIDLYAILFRCSCGHHC